MAPDLTPQPPSPARRGGARAGAPRYWPEASVGQTTPPTSAAADAAPRDTAKIASTRLSQ